MASKKVVYENYEKSRKREIAKTTLNQMGGYGKLESMVNARYFHYDDGDLTFRFSGSKEANLVKVHLNGDDLYDMTFYKEEMGHGVKEVGEIKDLYNDQLQNSFEDFTGTNISLTDRKEERIPICPPGYEFVRPHLNGDVRVKGFCRKIPDDRGQYFGFKSNREMMDHVRRLKER